MCGILGFYGQGLSEEFKAKFNYSLGLLKHRGPDGSRVWSNGKVMLGHTRLSIVDLSEASNQPMADISSRFQIVFNGEIYNYLEIRQELEGAGARFKTRSDTEVILEAYKMWGEDCLRRFNGMWAFAILDTVKMELFLSRDRYGVKPLYYSQRNGALYFASEMKAVLALGIDSDPDWGQIGRYLQGWGCDAGSDTPFKNIRSLAPGHKMIMGPDGCRVGKWWDVLEQKVQYPARFEERVEYFQELFEDAVRLRLRNDVDTGVALSGGMDSSSVYGAARKLQRKHTAKSATDGQDKRFRVFSVSYPNSPVDEYPWVEKCLNFWDDRENVSMVFPKPEIFPELINEVIWHQEAPVWSSAVFAFHVLYRHIASLGTRVILEGHGSDEMLGGYPYMVGEAIKSYSSQYDWRSAWEAAQCLTDTVNPALQQYSAGTLQNFLEVHSTYRRIKGISDSIVRKFNRKREPDIQGMNTGYINPDITSACPVLGTDLTDNKNQLDKTLYSAFTQRILPIVLRVFDRATMAYSVESRAPFMDYRLVQFIFSIPEKDKVGASTKKILRAAAKEWMPTEVINRKAKMGFAVAELEWFHTPCVSQYLADVFHSTDALNSNLFDGRTFARDLDRSQKEGFSRNDTVRIWEILNIHLWNKQLVVPFRQDHAS